MTDLVKENKPKTNNKSFSLVYGSKNNDDLYKEADNVSQTEMSNQPKIMRRY